MPRSSRPVLAALALLLAPVLGSREAAAQETGELVAFHPCVVTGEKDKDKAQDYEVACLATLAQGSVRLVPSEQVHGFLDKEPKKSCALAKKPAECLGRLATATQAARSVLITLTPGALTRVSGLVVDARGEVVDQKNIQLRNRGQSQEELLRTALTRLREQLDVAPMKLAALAPPPPTPSPPAVAPAPAPSAPPATASALDVRPEPPSVTASPRPSFFAGRSWKTPAAYAAAGVGVVALGMAGVLALNGERAMRASNVYYSGDRYPTSNDVPRIVALREQAHSQRVLAGVSTAVGAVLAGAGVYLWLHDRPAAAPSPGVSTLSVGPAGIHVLGVWP